MGPFQTKEEHLQAFVAAAHAIDRVVNDYRREETGYAKYRRDLDDALRTLADLSDLSLSDPNYVEPRPF